MLDIYAPHCLRKIVVREAYIPYRFVDSVTENADIPKLECDDFEGGGETEGCVNYERERERQPNLDKPRNDNYRM